MAKLTSWSQTTADTEKKKLGKKKAHDSSDDSEDKVDELEALLATAIAVDWKNPELSQKLLGKIAESKEIKQALYPLKKNFALWRLANELLGNDDKYKAALAAAAAGTTKDRAAWANKIKGRVRAMARTTQKYTQEMGETGAGIDNADEVSQTPSQTSGQKFRTLAHEVDISVIMSGVSTTTATDDTPREEEEDDAEDDAGTPFSNWNPDDSFLAFLSWVKAGSGGRFWGSISLGVRGG
ncbi:hypothetical protein C8R43DRAFT_955245 [Mycena crocata]|nr:hypothetical protein C8R43DRAFT_955245 [Mycena crocata]